MAKIYFDRIRVMHSYEALAEEIEAKVAQEQAEWFGRMSREYAWRTLWEWLARKPKRFLSADEVKERWISNERPYWDSPEWQITRAFRQDNYKFAKQMFKACKSSNRGYVILSEVEFGYISEHYNVNYGV